MLTHVYEFTEEEILALSDWELKEYLTELYDARNAATLRGHSLLEEHARLWKLDKDVVKESHRNFLRHDLYRTLAKIAEFVRWEGAIEIDSPESGADSALNDGQTVSVRRGMCDSGLLHNGG